MRSQSLGLRLNEGQGWGVFIQNSSCAAEPAASTGNPNLFGNTGDNPRTNAPPKSSPGSGCVSVN